MRKVQATIYAQDEPESTIYILTRADGSRLMADWPHPLIQLEPDAQWISGPYPTTGVGSNYAFSCTIPHYEGTPGRANIRARTNGTQKASLPEVPSLQVEVQPRQLDQWLQDLWPPGRSASKGIEGDPQMGDGAWVVEAPPGDDKP